MDLSLLLYRITAIGEKMAVGNTNIAGSFRNDEGGVVYAQQQTFRHAPTMEPTQEFPLTLAVLLFFRLGLWRGQNHKVH